MARARTGIGRKSEKGTFPTIKMKPIFSNIKKDSSRRTQLEAMKRQLLDKDQPKFIGKIQNKGEKRSPWNRIPSVSSFEVTTKEYNIFLESIGIRHKLPPKIKFERNPNHRLNRYIAHQITRMRKARSSNNHKLFWVIAKACLRSSVSFRLSAINHIKPNWWFGISAERIHQINRRVNKIFAKMTPEILFRRVYIPKPGNKWRPLGVPSDEWRIALHMLNNMLILWFEDEMLPTQHAYLPGKGTKTAWQQIIQEVIKAKNIYETDLKGFFDNISVFEINNILRQGNVSLDLRIWIYNMSKSLPKFPKDLKISEKRFDSSKLFDKINLREEFICPEKGYIVTTFRPQGSKVWYEDMVQELLNDERIPWMPFDKMSDEEFSKWLKTVTEQGLLSEYFLGFANRRASTPGGVPQGSPLSPFLAILAIREYLSQQRHVNYADDQIFYGDETFTIKDMPEKGIVHNMEKSGWIKKNGIWKKELKFLGLIYNPWTKELRSETRSSRTARIEDSLIELWEDIQYDKDENYLESMAQRNFFGFIQSCLYNGSWNPEQIATKERIVNPNSFLGRYVNSPVLSSALLEVLGKSLKVGVPKGTPKS